jgi:hypothetical protein
MRPSFLLTLQQNDIEVLIINTVDSAERRDGTKDMFSMWCDLAVEKL